MTSTSAPVVSSSSAGMQRGGRSWSETLRSGSRRVAHLWAKCAALCFCRTGLTGGLGQAVGTGGLGQAVGTGLTG